MSFSIDSVGMKAGGRYEAIYTTTNKKGEMNAAPIGVKCFGDVEFAARIFEGSRTLENIRETGVFVVNITSDPLIFTRATMGNLEEEEFIRDDDLAILKDADAYFIALATSIEELVESDHVGEDGKSFVIKAEAIKVVINKAGAKAINRGVPALLDSLVNFTRIELVDEDTLNNYISRFRENERLIKKVGTEDTKESMEILKENLIKKGIDL